MKIQRGMILCAGLGTRLHPITQSTPKPLVPILNLPNVLYSIDLLRRAGIRDLILNVHHLPHLLEAYLGDGKRWGVRIEYSREKILLGTGGGVKKAEPFFKSEPFVVINCDFITNADLNPLIARHFERKALATMILLEDRERQAHYSKVGVDNKQQLCALPKLKTKNPQRNAIFTGIHILTPELLVHLKEEPSGINDILYPYLMKEMPNRVYGDFLEGAYWYDTGDIPSFLQSSLALLNRLQKGDEVLKRLVEEEGYREIQTSVWAKEGEKPIVSGPAIIGSDCQWDDKIKIGPQAVVGQNSILKKYCTVQESVLLPSSEIAEGEKVKQFLVYHQSRLSG